MINEKPLIVWQGCQSSELNKYYDIIYEQDIFQDLILNKLDD